MSKSRRAWLGLLGLLGAALCAAAPAAGQTTRPSGGDTPSSSSSGDVLAGKRHPGTTSTTKTTTTRATRAPRTRDWPVAVDQFAKALVDEMDPIGAVRDFTDLDCCVRCFDGGNLQIVDVINRAAGTVVVSAHGYRAPATSIASDLAADIASSTAVPDDIKKEMLPEEGEQTRRANETATQWVGRELQPGEADPVGVIILWSTDAPASTPIKQRLVILLVRGETAQDGTYRIKQVVYGDPQQALK
jgi:hypothetical protein